MAQMNIKVDKFIGMNLLEIGERAVGNLVILTKFATRFCKDNNKL